MQIILFRDFLLQVLCERRIKMSFSLNFKGNYHVRTNENSSPYSFNVINKISKHPDFLVNTEFKQESNSPTLDCEIVAPDKYDNELEGLFLQLGVKFNRSGSFNGQIHKKMSLPEGNEKGLQMVYLDVDKFDEIKSSQLVNPVIKLKYRDDKALDAKKDLLSGEKVQAPVFNIKSFVNGGAEGFVHYVDEFGKDAIIDESLFFDFNDTELDESRYFFAMREFGLKQIPVCVDEDTFIVGKKLGLLNKENPF